jgi:CRP/FNR family transcriptional regulator, cyclic AMP receptor protein
VKKQAKPTISKRPFDTESFLASSGEGRTIVELKNKETAYCQGDPADSVYYIQKGRIKISVLSMNGKEAILALLTAGEFFGESSIAMPITHRQNTAQAVNACTLLRIDKKAMRIIIHQEHAFADRFVDFLLESSSRIQEDLVDQLFNSSEKRLARVLLRFAHFGEDANPESTIPKISQQALAEMIGTTRPRVNFFMCRFRRLGYIKYNGEIHIHRTLLTVLLDD